MVKLIIRLQHLNFSSVALILKTLMKTNTDRTLDVVFSRFRGFSFTITLRQKPKGVTRMLSLCLVIQCDMHVTPLGVCLRVIVNENPLKTSSSVLSVFFLKLWLKRNPQNVLPWSFILEKRKFYRKCANVKKLQNVGFLSILTSLEADVTLDRGHTYFLLHPLDSYRETMGHGLGGGWFRKVCSKITIFNGKLKRFL